MVSCINSEDFDVSEYLVHTACTLAREKGLSVVVYWEELMVSSSSHSPITSWRCLTNGSSVHGYSGHLRIMHSLFFISHTISFIISLYLMFNGDNKSFMFWCAVQIHTEWVPVTPAMMHYFGLRELNSTFNDGCLSKGQFAATI